MSRRSAVIMGLPESGKTTFLAALWHLIIEGDQPTRLRFSNLLAGNSGHLNAIADRWRTAQVQERTAIGGNRLVSMNLVDGESNAITVTFPDVEGERFRDMWVDRECHKDTVPLLQQENVLLFIHADKIKSPRWVMEEVAVLAEMGCPPPDGEAVAWDAKDAPTQVQLIDLLQLLRQPPLDVGPRRLAIMLSAWDKVRDEGLSPLQFLQQKLPLLAQFLQNNIDDWEWRVYGVSAQGGDYDKAEQPHPSPGAQAMREMDKPSERIALVSDTTHHDLTEPLEWLVR